MIRHPSALVDTKAGIGERVAWGAYAVIGAADIGDGCIIYPHVVIGDGITLGANCEVFSGTVVGREPKAAGVTSRKMAFDPTVTIGEGCSIGCTAVLFYDVTIGAGALISDGACISEQDQISRCVRFDCNSVIGDRVKSWS